MAVIEKANTRRTRWTQEGLETRLTLQCSRADYDAWVMQTITPAELSGWQDAFYSGEDVIPVIGQPYSNARPDIICIEIEPANMPTAEEHYELEIAFSTAGAAFISRQADMAASWQEEWEASVSPYSLATYYDQAAGEWKAWSAVWAAAGGDVEEVPSLTMFEHVSAGRATMHVTAYASTAWFKLWAGGLGKINSRQFLTSPPDSDGSPMNNGYADLRRAAARNWVLDYNLDDTRRWLVSGFRIQMLNPGTWEHSLTLDLAVGASDWQSDYGIATNKYEELDFRALLSPMSMVSSKGFELA